MAILHAPRDSPTRQVEREKHPSHDPDATRPEYPRIKTICANANIRAHSRSLIANTRPTADVANLQQRKRTKTIEPSSARSRTASHARRRIVRQFMQIARGAAKYRSTQFTVPEETRFEAKIIAPLSTSATEAENPCIRRPWHPPPHPHHPRASRVFVRSVAFMSLSQL
ncbi:hypothetical protein [Lysobacter capsici]|uniref:hypothetical protein n=1 Tax=Lysobacter capsici TaxID=435897 RepID=UPI0011E068D8|nr:hypothetical protein [Lysobacter capsici]